MSEVFSSPVLKVEQPRRGPFAKSQYKVMDGDGTVLAIAGQTNDEGRSEMRGLFPGKSNLDARAVLLTTPDGEPLLMVDKQSGREYTEVFRPDGERVGSFVTERVGRRYVIYDDDGTFIGAVDVDVPRNNFLVKDADGGQVAHVRKKWAGLATHLLTTADKYSIEISDPVREPLRTMAVMTAIVMDMNLHEAKEIT
ncbi:phospholipid scramblase-related protein [Actinomadura chokoriensis]|uniref:phospholipid scramblase-related protein n=1 Tax=Actinomadura chokoriensis TaxID=454156 RepID=UPI0031F7F0B0